MTHCFHRPGSAVVTALFFSLVLSGCQPRANDQSAERSDLPPRPTPETLAATHDHGHAPDPADDNYWPETLRSEVRNAAVAQMLHRLEHTVFASSVEELGYTPSDKIALQVVAQDSSGFTVVGQYHGVPAHECAIRHGAIAAPRPYVAQEGIAYCG